MNCMNWMPVRCIYPLARDHREERLHGLIRTAVAIGERLPEHASVRRQQCVINPPRVDCHALEILPTSAAQAFRPGSAFH